MDAFDMLRQVLQTQVIAAGNANGLTNISLMNESPKPPRDGSIWAEFWYRTGNSKPHLGGGRRGFRCTPGIWQITLYVEEGKGGGAITKLADKLHKWFDTQQWIVAPDGYVTLGACSVDPLPMAKNGNQVVLVHGDFDFIHRNTDAQTYGV